MLRSMHHILSVAVAISLLPVVHSAAFTFSCSYHNLLRKDADTKCTERPSPRWRGRCAARLGTAQSPLKPCHLHQERRNPREFRDQLIAELPRVSAFLVQMAWLQWGLSGAKAGRAPPP